MLAYVGKKEDGYEPFITGGSDSKDLKSRDFHHREETPSIHEQVRAGAPTASAGNETRGETGCRSQESEKIRRAGPAVPEPASQRIDLVGENPPQSGMIFTQGLSRIRPWATRKEKS